MSDPHDGRHYEEEKVMHQAPYVDRLGLKGRLGLELRLLRLPLSIGAFDVGTCQALLDADLLVS